MKNWEWMNENAENPKNFEEMLIETYTTSLIELVEHYTDSKDLISALERFDSYMLFNNIKNWLNSEHK